MSDTKENKKTFGDLKSGDTVWIGWADEERGKFGHIREIQVLNVLASRTKSIFVLWLTSGRT